MRLTRKEMEQKPYWVISRTASFITLAAFLVFTYFYWSFKGDIFVLITNYMHFLSGLETKTESIVTDWLIWFMVFFIYVGFSTLILGIVKARKERAYKNACADHLLDDLIESEFVMTDDLKLRMRNQGYLSFRDYWLVKIPSDQLKLRLENERSIEEQFNEKYPSLSHVPNHKSDDLLNAGSNRVSLSELESELGLENEKR